MGAECFTGNNNDYDLNIKTTRERNINNNLKEFYSDCRPRSSKNKYTSQQYETIYNGVNNRNRKEYLSYSTGNKKHKEYKEYKEYKIYKNKEYIQNQSRANSLKLINKGKRKNIHNFTREELEDQVNDILRIRIPFFENSILKTLSAFTFLSGNGPYHEGLMFFTTNKNFYIAQSYPITFIKVYDFYKGISEIISFNNINKNSKKYTISEIYTPQESIPLYDVLNIINDLPNKYNLLNDNCQNFCNNILDSLNRSYKIEMDDKPNIEKINFLKKQKKIKHNLIPNNHIQYNGRFSNI